MLKAVYRTILGLIFWAGLLSGAPAADVQYDPADSLISKDFWNGLDELLLSSTASDTPPIPNITVRPETGMVGLTEIYEIDITLEEPGIPNRGGIVLSFPDNFSLENLFSAEYTDDFSGDDLIIRNAYVRQNRFYVLFKKGQPPPPRTIVTLTLRSITNPDRPDNYQIAGAIFNKWFNVVSGPTLSEPFDITGSPPAEIKYIDDSMSPMVTYNDFPQRFTFDLELSGAESLSLDGFNSRFELLYNSEIIIGTLLKDYVLVPGLNRLSTSTIYFPESWIGREPAPQLILKGAEPHADFIDTVFFEDLVILISDRTDITPQIKISSTEIITVNPPYVNYDQLFEIAVTIDNISDYPADSIELFILSEDAQDTLATASGIFISGHQSFDTSFTLLAPDTSAPAILYRAEIRAAAAVEILSPDDNLASITVQSPALIGLALDLSDIGGGYVQFNQPFTITARFVNTGEAAAGAGEISLMISSGDFGIPDSTARTVAFGENAVWDLIAPSTTTEAEFTFRITQIPPDLNTGDPARISTISIGVPIFVESISGSIIVSGRADKSPFLQKGAVQDLFRLSLENRSALSTNLAQVKSVFIEFKDRNNRLVPAENVVACDQTGFTINDMFISSCRPVNDRLAFDFESLFLNPDDTVAMIFMADIIDNITLKDFTVSLDSRDILVELADGPFAGQIIPVLNEDGGIFTLEATFVIVPDEPEQSPMLKNNPFDPGEGPAEILYYLPEDTDVDFIVFTLNGDKVYQRFYRAGLTGGAAGENIITWDGTNENGDWVNNGVYVAVIHAPETGFTNKLKIAVMK